MEEQEQEGNEEEEEKNVGCVLAALSVLAAQPGVGLMDAQRSIFASKEGKKGGREDAAGQQDSKTAAAGRREREKREEGRGKRGDER